MRHRDLGTFKVDNEAKTKPVTNRNLVAGGRTVAHRNFATIFVGGWPTSFGGGGGDDRGHVAEPKSSTPPGPTDLGHTAHRNFATVFLVMLVTAHPLISEGQTVVITGGADASGHTYTWQVRNGGASPIVEVRFPHYRAGLFFPPPGWSSDCTALVHVGAKDEPGVCTARAAAPADGIAPEQFAPFSMQIAPAGAKRGPGEVTVRFADGSEARVAGVELPRQEGLGDKYVSLIALGGVFTIFVMAQAVRKRRRRVRRRVSASP